MFKVYLLIGIVYVVMAILIQTIFGNLKEDFWEPFGLCSKGAQIIIFTLLVLSLNILVLIWPGCVLYDVYTIVKKSI